LPISAVDTISLAVEHTKQQLFKPFRIGQWTKLAFVGLLAGELGSGGCNGSSFQPPRQSGVSLHSIISSLSAIDGALLGGIIATLIITGLAFGLIMMYISSAMRFVLFDSILAKECHIRASWSNRQGPAVRYFLWKLLYVVATFGCLVLLVGVPLAFAFAAGWLQNAKQHVLPLALGGILLFFVLLIFFVIAALIFVFTKDFVIPQMALEEIGAIEAWRRLWPMISAEKSAYVIYIAMKIALAIGAGIVVGIATVILGLIVAIPTVGLSIFAVITGKSAGLTWNAYTITIAIVIGCILLAAFLYLVSLVAVPVIVFFPAYSIYFFASRYRPLNAVLYPLPPATAVISSSSPLERPPLPPYPEPAG
jgi:hypothetical protein